ncbi:MAG: alpha/beta fold hydrolase [Xanthomonadaceae bacterium]|nr:alpha/beta fold hydrolase [Xanthomonadaceae bacterium]
MIERRRGAHRPEVRTRLLVASAIALSIGLALAGSRIAWADEAPPPAQPASETPTVETSAVEAPVVANQAAASEATESTPADSAAFDAISEAVGVLDRMDAGDFAAVHARFDATMSAAVGVEQLRQAWATLPTQFGASKGRGEPRERTEKNIRVVRIPLHMERGELMAIVGFDEDQKIAGFGVRPAPSDASNASAASSSATPPAGYVAPPLPEGVSYTEREVVVGEAATGLGATLALPNGKGPFPAVVLVHGSGPQNRDETVGPNHPFLEIARGLAERGIATLRYDKRTKARPLDYANGIDVDSETTDDAVLAIAALRGEAKIDAKRVFVFGHSQGGMMAPRIAKRSAERGHEIAGLVLLAAPSRSLLDILIEQTRRLSVLDDGKTSPLESAAIADISRRVAAVRRGGEVAPQDSPAGLPAAYWRSFDAVDPVGEARALAQPLLILQGTADIQVVDADWQGWKAGFHDSPRATFKLYENLNHLAIPSTTGTLAEYQTPGQVDATLIDDVAAWIAASAPAKPAPKSALKPTAKRTAKPATKPDSAPKK